MMWRSLEKLMKWLSYALLLSAPAFFCIDIAAADYVDGVTPNDASWLFSRSRDRLLSDEQMVKAYSLAPRYWLMPAAIFAISFIIATWPRPYPLKPGGSGEHEVLAALGIISLLGICIFGVMFINSYIGIPALISAVNASLRDRTLNQYLTIIEISDYYFLTSFITTCNELIMMAGGNVPLSIIAALSPFFIIPSISSMIGVSIGGMIGAHRYKEYRRRMDLEWEASEREFKPGGFESYLRAVSWNHEKPGADRPKQTAEYAEEKMQETPDIRIFREHLRRTIEEAKRREKRAEEPSEDKQRSKGRVERKDRTYYII